MEYIHDLNEKISIFEDSLFEYCPIYIDYLLENKDTYMPWLKVLEDYDEYNYDISPTQKEIIQEERLISKYDVKSYNYVCPLTDCSAYREDDNLYISTAILEETVPLYFDGKVYYNTRVWWRYGNICDYHYSYVQNKVCCTETTWSMRNGDCKIYLDSEHTTYKYYSRAQLVVQSLLHAIGRDDLIDKIRENNWKCLTLNTNITPSMSIYIAQRNERYSFIKNCIMCPNIPIDIEEYDKVYMYRNGQYVSYNTLDTAINTFNTTSIREYLIKNTNFDKNNMASSKKNINDFIKTKLILDCVDKDIENREYNLNLLMNNIDDYIIKDGMSIHNYNKLIDDVVERNKELLTKTMMLDKNIDKSILLRSYLLEREG